jgi:hypothetical protein
VPFWRKHPHRQSLFSCTTDSRGNHEGRQIVSGRIAGDSRIRTQRRCTLHSHNNRIQHVVYIQLDNVHFGAIRTDPFGNDARKKLARAPVALKVIIAESLINYTENR